MRPGVLVPGVVRMSTFGAEPVDTTPPCIIVDGASATVYATVAELITAEAGGIAAGYYEATSAGLRVYYDGVDFLDPLGNAVSLSPIMDHIADVKMWLRGSRFVAAGGGVASGTPTLVAWGAETPHNAYAELFGTSGVLLGAINTAPAIDVTTSYLEVVDVGTDYDIDAPFEVFAAIKLDTNTDTNAGIVGKFSGGVGWLLSPAESSSPYGVLFGFSGTYARASSRLGTDPHVVSGRYDGTNVVVSVDGVDIATTAATGSANTATTLAIGSYGSAATTMDGKIAELAIIKKSLTVDERAAIVADMLARISP